MKRIVIFFTGLFCCDSIYSQAEFQIFVGPHISSTNYSIKSVTQPTDSKVGFHVGAGYKITFDGILFFSPSISYAMRGYKVQFNQPSYPPDLLAIDNNTTFHEIDVDPLLQFDLSKKANHPFIKVGPSFNFILWGKESYNLATGESIDRNLKLSTTNNYGRYNASLVGQFGYETSKGLIIYAYYLRGLISMNNEEQGPSIYNSMYGLTLGKFLKSKKK
jgi:Outer membrane protein beta-barrel domain